MADQHLQLVWYWLEYGFELADALFFIFLNATPQAQNLIPLIPKRPNATEVDLYKYASIPFD